MARKLQDDEKNGGARKASPGDNGGGGIIVTEEQFRNAVEEISDWRGRIKSLNEGFKAVRKKHKANGIELGDLDAAVRMAEWDREEVRAHFARRRQYAEWLGLPVQAVPDTFKDMTGEERASHEWEARGRTAALASQGAEPPEECPMEMRKHFAKGFNTAMAGGNGGKPRAKQADKAPAAEKEKSDTKKPASLADARGRKSAKAAEAEAGGGVKPANATKADVVEPEEDEGLDPAFR